MLSYCISIAWAGVTAGRHASRGDKTNMRIVRRAVNKPSRSFIVTGESSCKGILLVIKNISLWGAFNKANALEGALYGHCEISRRSLTALDTTNMRLAQCGSVIHPAADNWDVCNIYRCVSTLRTPEFAECWWGGGAVGGEVVPCFISTRQEWWQH